MRRLVKMKYPITLWTIRPGSRSYVRCDKLDHKSGLETIHPLRGFQGEPHFSPLVLLFSKSTPDTIKGFLSRNEPSMQRDLAKLI
jgi:hypothetical protein